MLARPHSSDSAGLANIRNSPQLERLGLAGHKSAVHKHFVGRKLADHKLVALLSLEERTRELCRPP